MSSADLQARPAPHRFTYEYTASSTCSCDDQRAITMNGTVYVSASLSANDSYVSLDSPAATIEAGSAMTFSITPMDAYGKEILQDADLSFSTELSHYDDSTEPVVCEVVYENESHVGMCQLPSDDDGHPLAGSFSLDVSYGVNNNRIGGTAVAFTIDNCPEHYYADPMSDGRTTCQSCSDMVKCPSNITLSRLNERPGSYRLNEHVSAAYVRTCPNRAACDGGKHAGDASWPKPGEDPPQVETRRFFSYNAPCTSSSTHKRRPRPRAWCSQRGAFVALYVALWHGVGGFVFSSRGLVHHHQRRGAFARRPKSTGGGSPTHTNPDFMI